jgi:hypothetical protein
MPRSCWAAGQTCYGCGGIGHYARSAACPAKETRGGGSGRQAAGQHLTRGPRRYSYSNDGPEIHVRRVTSYARPEQIQQQDEWQVQKRRHRKYTARRQGQDGTAAAKERCADCFLGHRQGSCRAAGQRCYDCQGYGHYARACLMGGEYVLDAQQGGRRADHSSDSSSDMESFHDTEGPKNEPSDGSTSGTQEESKQPEQDSQLLESEGDRLSRALATWDGYQGTEPGLEGDKSEGTGEKPEEAESSAGEDDGLKALREGTEPAWPGSQQWKKQMGRKSKKKKLKQGKLL